MNIKKAIILAATISIVSGCGGGDVVGSASLNLSKAFDMFEINRRIVFFDTIQGKYLLLIEGRCLIEQEVAKKHLSVTCKTGHNDFKKHFLGISDNVTYFAEQVESAKTSVYHYRVIFKPEAIVPNIDLETSLNKK